MRTSAQAKHCLITLYQKGYADMCIVLYKPAGIELPYKRVLHGCWDNNPDGGGFCYVNNGEVIGYKGYMSFKRFWKALRTYVQTSTPAIIHMRIGTSGVADGSATHPFPVSADTAELRALRWSADVATAHNGMLSGYGSSRGKAPLSDTQEFIAKVLASPWTRDKLLDPGAKPLLEAATRGSRFVFIDSSGNVSMLGQWIEDKELYWSNDGYKAQETAGLQSPYMPPKTEDYMHWYWSEEERQCPLYGVATLSECTCECEHWEAGACAARSYNMV